MSIETISNPLVEFSIRLIAHKFYQSSKLNRMLCIAIDLGYKIVKRDHSYNLAKLQLQQLTKNLGSIRRSKISSCKFGSLIMCILFYVQNTFPTFGQVSWKTSRAITEHINDML